MQSESENELENELTSAEIVPSTSVRRFSLETEFDTSSENDWFHDWIYGSNNENDEMGYDPRNWPLESLNAYSEIQLHAELTSEHNLSTSSDETYIESGVNNQLVDLSTVGWGTDEEIPERSVNALMFEESVDVAENIVGEDVFMIEVPPEGIAIEFDYRNDWLITSNGGEFEIEFSPNDEYEIINRDERERLIGEENLLDEPIWWRPWE